MNNTNESTILTPDQVHFFWKGPLSQWHKEDFVVDGVTYNCAEQWMMACKAALFQDDVALENILASDSPREQKKIGRGVHNFDENMWNVACLPFVFRGNIAKFTQSITLCNMLMDTEEKMLVEASPMDRIWGIGMAEDDPDVYDTSKWGLNWLGKSLMDVRSTLIHFADCLLGVALKELKSEQGV